MPFNSNRDRGHAGQDSMWTSYSDLFLGLSVVFLLLYVTASLRQGTDGIRQHMEYQQLTKENQDIKKQLEVYSTLKQEYLKKEASQDEQDAYSELMSKLDLLQEQAKEEKIKLRQQADDNGKKEVALNKYQQMIRNIMNANMIAKSRIKNRDVMITDQTATIKDQGSAINGLEDTLQEKKQIIAKGEAKINDLETNLDEKLKELKKEYKHNQITKKKYEAQQAALKEQAETKIEALQTQNQHAEADIKKINSELAQTQKTLDTTKTQLDTTKNENAKLETEIQGATAKHNAEVAKLKGDFDSQQAREKAAFDDALKKEKLTNGEKARREGEFRAAAEAKAKAMGDQLAGLNNKYNDATAQMKKMKGDFEAQQAGDKKAFEDALNKEKLSGAERARREGQFRAAAEAKAKAMGDQLSGLANKYNAQGAELAKAQENLNAKHKIAQQIKANFAKNGIKADVDEKTGDVLLSFGDQYFDSGSANLKAGMKKILEQAVPVYSSSLFENQQIADKISNVEIVGFASPTFKGKYIDPRSLNPDDRTAVNYNLDLSYGRARSIFNHVFDQSKMQFKYQKRLLPLVKVTGRSFFDQADRGPAGEAQEQFCHKNDCAKLQRVIIKFNLKD